MPNSDTLKPSPLSGGQSVRIAGSSRTAALYDQLYRYADDLQQLIESNGQLEARYETLRESTDRLMGAGEALSDLMRSSKDIHIVTDAAGTILQSNPEAATLAPLDLLAGHKLEEWVAPSFIKAFRRLQNAALEGDKLSDQSPEIHLHRKTGADSPLIVSAQVLGVREGGEVRHIHWILRDMTHLRETEFETEVATMVFAHASEGIMITGIDGTILSVNPAFTRITGYSAEDIVGQTPRLLSSGLHDAAFYQTFWRSLRDKGSWQGELSNRKKSGEIYPEWLTVSSVRSSDGGFLSYIGVFSDLSNLLQAESRMYYLANHDIVTGLPNRLLFQDRLGQTIAESKRSGEQFTVIFIDLDKFKPINDSFGHSVGDKVLQEVGNRLSANVRECDTAARIGGDEFVILSPGLAGDANIEIFCTKLISALRQPIQVDGLDLFVGASFGCAVYPTHGEDGAMLLKRADAAMYQAKSAGGSTYAIYDIASATVLGQARPHA